MGLDELGNLRHSGLPVHRQIALAELLGHPRAHHVDSEDAPAGPVVVAVGDDLDQPVGLPHDHGPPVAHEAVRGGNHLEPRLFGRRLGVAHEGHLGMAVDGPRDIAVVHRRGRLPQQVFHHQNGLGKRHVGQLRGANHIAYGVHPRCGGLAELIHRHITPVVHLYAGGVQTQAVGKRAAAHTHHHCVHAQGVGAFDLQLHAVAGVPTAAHRDAGANLDLALLECPGQHLDHVVVCPQQDPRQRF